MSKRAENKAQEYEKSLDYYHYTGDNPSVAYKEGYEQAEKDTTQRALDWLRAHTKSYVGPIEEPFWTMFIEHFKKAMEDK